MSLNIQRLPEEIENEIKEFTLTPTVRLELLLHRYPIDKMDNLFKDFTKEGLDRVYRYGCVSKVLQCDRGSYTWSSVNPIIKEVLKNDTRSYRLFTYTCWPVSVFNSYWETGNKKMQPSRPEYINRIKRFCDFILAFSRNNPLPNEQFVSFCEKLVYDIIVGSLIMRRNM